MTLDETRQLGIEFERKLQTIDPTEKIVTKVDTEDIYAYLNMYQELYIKQLYLLDLSAESDTRPSNRILDILRPLVCRSSHIPTDSNDRADEFDLLDDYWLYVRSSSIVTGTYKNYKHKKEIPNIEFKQADVNDLLDTAYDSDRIMRNPIIVMAQYLDPNSENDRFEVLHDRYTTILFVKLVYIRKPNFFSVLTETPCELPVNCFEDLVNGAVELYFNDKYKLAIASTAARNRSRKNDDDNTTSAS